MQCISKVVHANMNIAILKGNKGLRKDPGSDPGSDPDANIDRE